jgi:hypothetical protein
MADITISGLSPITPATGLFLPASNGTTTGNVTLSQVCGVMTSSQITNALGYTPYNGTTNPNGYIANSITEIYAGYVPSYSTGPFGEAYSSFNVYNALIPGLVSLAGFKFLKLSLRNVGFTAANTRIALGSVATGSASYISHNNASASINIWVDCMIDLVNQTLVSVSENSNSIQDNGTSYIFHKTLDPYNITSSSQRITIYTSGTTNYFDGGTFRLLGIK